MTGNRHLALGRIQSAMNLLALALKDVKDGDDLDALDAVDKALFMMQSGLTSVVWCAIKTGHTWQEVGDTLGITRQAAWQRF